MKYFLLCITCILLTSCNSPSKTIPETTEQIEQLSKPKLFDGYQLTPYPSALFKPGYTFYYDASNIRQIASTGENLSERTCVPGRTPSLSAKSTNDLKLALGWLLKAFDFNIDTASKKGVSIDAEEQAGCTESFSNLIEQAKYIRSIKDEVREAISVDPIFNIDNLYLVTEAIRVADFKVKVAKWNNLQSSGEATILTQEGFQSNLDDTDEGSKTFEFKEQNPQLFVFMKLTRVKLGSSANGELTIEFEAVDEPK